MVSRTEECGLIRKSDIVRRLVAEKQYKKALRIAKDFRLGITPEQAYECMVHERFYLSLGENTRARIAEGIDTIVSIYGRENDKNGEVVYQQIQQ